MKNLSTLAAGVLAFGFASSASLAANRTFVSGVGTDTGTCAITAPCRTFAYALTQTAASGEIIVLSSGGYGSVTVSQAVSIINTSNFAGVTVASGNGITINAGVNDSVVLRGISVDGGGTGANGIVLNSGGKLTIDQCNLINFVGSSTAGNGILMRPTSDTTVSITNTTAENNQAAGIAYVVPPSSSPVGGLVLDHVIARNNGTGVGINNTGSGLPVRASISNSIASGNGTAGFNFVQAVISLDASYVIGNFEGVVTNAGTVAVGRSVIANNSDIGLESGGTVNSYGDNRIAGNGTQESGTITHVNPQ